MDTETVTPAIAEAWLEHNALNRPLRLNVARRYADMMRRGQWMQIGDPIRFDITGRLLDGQHRLKAIVDAGVTLELVVIRDLPTESFQVMDTGRSRTPGDVLSMLGYSNTAFMGAAVRMLVVLDAGMSPGNNDELNLVTREDIVEWVQAHPEINEQITRAKSLYDRMGAGSCTAFGVFQVLATRVVGDGPVWEFTEALADGAGLDAGDPRLALRNYLLRQRGRSRAEQVAAGAGHRVVLSATLVRTFNAWLAGKKMSTIAVRYDDKFPEVVVPEIKTHRAKAS